MATGRGGVRCALGRSKVLIGQTRAGLGRPWAGHRGGRGTCLVALPAMWPARMGGHRRPEIKQVRPALARLMLDRQASGHGWAGQCGASPRHMSRTRWRYTASPLSSVKVRSRRAKRRDTSRRTGSWAIHSRMGPRASSRLISTSPWGRQGAEVGARIQVGWVDERPPCQRLGTPDRLNFTLPQRHSGRSSQ